MADDVGRTRVMQVAEWVIDLGKQLADLRNEVHDLRCALAAITGGSGPVSGRAKAPPAQPTDSIDGLDNPAEIE